LAIYFNRHTNWHNVLGAWVILRFNIGIGGRPLAGHKTLEKNMTTMIDMLKAGVHFGHRTRFWNPKMAPYIYGQRQQIHIINLEETLPRFKEMLDAAENIIKKNGKILFVGTKFSARNVIHEEAVRCGMPYVDHRWLGGMLTNYKTIRQSVRRLITLEEQTADEKYLENLTKKETLMLIRQRDKLSASLGGVKQMGGLPDMIFVIDVQHEKTAIQEANRLSIPVAAIVDTNSNPENIDYMVPGNDDAIRSVRLYCKTLADRIIATKGKMALTEKRVAPKKEKGPVVVTKKEKTASVAVKQVEEDKPAEKKVVEKKATAEEKAPAAKKPAAKKEAAKKPAAKKAAAKKPAAKKAAAKKPAAKKAAAKKPAAKKTDSDK
jgi:small subunit ribosomal protein S2